jgi:hypothetical protein
MEQMPWVQSASMICSSSFDSLGCAISIYYTCFGFYYMISDLASIFLTAQTRLLKADLPNGSAAGHGWAGLEARPTGVR